MERKKPGTTSEFLDRLNDAFSDVPAGNLDELEADLREEGVNVDEVVAGVLGLVEKAFPKESWQERARKERAAVIEQLERRRRARAIDPSVLQQRVSEFRAQAQFRKFEKATEKDLESLVEDEDLVGELDEMGKPTGKGK